MTLAEAAKVLGISAEVIRGRVRRKPLPVEREGGAVYVLLDAPVDGRPSTRRVRPTSDRPNGRSWSRPCVSRSRTSGGSSQRRTPPTGRTAASSRASRRGSPSWRRRAPRSGRRPPRRSKMGRRGQSPCPPRQGPRRAHGSLGGGSGDDRWYLRCCRLGGWLVGRALASTQGQGAQRDARSKRPSSTTRTSTSRSGARGWSSIKGGASQPRWPR